MLPLLKEMNKTNVIKKKRGRNAMRERREMWRVNDKRRGAEARRMIFRYFRFSFQNLYLTAISSHHDQKLKDFPDQ